MSGVAISVFTSILVFVVGQLISKFFLDPAQELRRTVGRIRHDLSLHRATIHTPIGRSVDNCERAREALMRGSSALIADLHAIPAYTGLSLLSCEFLPPKKHIESAATDLRGLSTLIYPLGSGGDPNKQDRHLEEIRARVSRLERALDFTSSNND